MPFASNDQGRLADVRPRRRPTAATTPRADHGGCSGHGNQSTTRTKALRSIRWTLPAVAELRLDCSSVSWFGRPPLRCGSEVRDPSPGPQPGPCSAGKPDPWADGLSQTAARVGSSWASTRAVQRSGCAPCRWEPGTPAPTSIPGASSDQAWPGEHAVTDRRAPRTDQQQPPRSWCSSPRSRLGRSQGPQGRWSTPAAREERPRSDR